MSKILCIEDEADFREDIVRILQDEGYKTLEASNGKEGLDVITHQHPDLVLCDINMPIMSGFEILKKLRSNNPEDAAIPFVFLTAMGQKKDILHGIELCADDYMIKPIDFDVLLATVRSRLEKYRLLRENFSASNVNASPSTRNNRLLLSEIKESIEDITELSDVMRHEAFGAMGQLKYKECSQQIYTAGFDLVSLINDAMLPNYHDTSSFTSQMLGEAVSVQMILEDVTNQVQPLASARQITFHTSVQKPSLMLRVEGQVYTKALVSLLTEIIENAAPYADISINVKCLDGGRVQVVLHGAFESMQAFTNVNILFMQDILFLHGGEAMVESSARYCTIEMVFPAERVA